MCSLDQAAALAGIDKLRCVCDSVSDNYSIRQKENTVVKALNALNLSIAICFVFCMIPAAAALAQQAPREIPLWPNGAPGFESRRNEPAVAKDYWIANILNP